MTPAGLLVMHGQAGPVLLGPTQARVARWLDAATRHGLVTLRSAELAGRLGLERSELYRVTRRLRILGLFGIADDRGGTAGGRRYWRTPAVRGLGLDPLRHRAAWARLVAWAAARARRLAHVITSPARPVPAPTMARSAEAAFGHGPTFAERLHAAGMGELLRAWGVHRGD